MNRKPIFLMLCVLAATFDTAAAPADEAMRRAIADAYAAIDLYERTTTSVQSLEEINAAAREEVIDQLHLSAAQRKTFEPLYDAYRRELAATVQIETATDSADEATRREALKQRLDNIAAAARVKRDYVDRFAEVLTAEQIRLLYNAEANIGTQIKTTSAARTVRSLTLRGTGKTAERDFGPAGEYTTLIVPTRFKVTLSPTARTIRVKADERIIDYISAEVSNGEVRFRLNIKKLNLLASTDFRGIQVEMPASAKLQRLDVLAYASIDSPQPLQSDGNLRVDIQSAGQLSADLEYGGTVQLLLSSYGRFKGTITCGRLNLSIGSAATIDGPIQCRGRADISLSSYAQLKSDLRAGDAVKLLINSAAKVSGTIESGSTELQVSSYAQINGTIRSARLKAFVSSNGTADIAYTGEAFEAQISSYGWLKLSGNGPVARGMLDVGSRGRFSAPDLPVQEYAIHASSYSSLDIRCEQRLQLDAASMARVENHGPAQADPLP